MTSSADEGTGADITSVPPVDLTTDQPPITRREPPATPRRRVGIQQLLEELAATARERAAAAGEDREARQAYQSVARLAGELVDALGALPRS